MASERSGAEVIRMPLSRRPCGIETFRVEGAIDDAPVQAWWDGRWMAATTLLCEHLRVAIAVEAAFVALDSRRGPTPEDLMLAIVECCDTIDVAEFEVHGCRRVIQSYD